MSDTEYGQQESLFCKTSYDDDHFINRIVGHLVTCSILIVMAVLIVLYWRRRNQSPIKERAGTLSIIQMVGFFSLLVILYFTEIVLSMNLFDWEANKDDDDDIPWVRRLIKSLYLSIRIMTYCLFVFR